MREHAEAIEHVSAERIGGGLGADGMGELSKLLLGAHPAKALRLARETGVLAHLLPEYGTELDDERFAAVQRAEPELAVRLALFLDGLGPERAGAALRRLRYPTRLRDRVVRIVREQAFDPPREPVEARRFLARHGVELASDLVSHRAARRGDGELEATARLLEQEASSAHQLSDLAVSGADLLAIGYREGPNLGHTLRTLLDEVVEDPSRNEREHLLARAKELA
jgi:tRNA nucleotidyltransferase (CCA-adding enzyme)